MHAYTRCKGAKCPHCVGGWISRLLNRALEAWDGQQVYRAVFTSDAQWKNNVKRAREIKRDYKGRYLRVRIGSEGESWVFAPGPIGEPVPSPGLAVADALLRAPAAGHRRYSGIPAKRTENAEPSGWVAFHLPENYRLEDANRIVESVLDRPVEWTTDPYWRGFSSRQFVLRGLTPQEVDRVQQALQPLREMAEAEFRERYSRSSIDEIRVLFPSARA